MSEMKRLFICILSAAFAFSASAQHLTVLHMNDTHSHIDPERSGKYVGQGGAVEMAAYIDEVRAAQGKKNVLLLHAGDFGQGTSYFSELHGDIEIELLNALGFDATCLGNHEFDNGMEELARRLRSLKTSVVCANYDFSGTPLDGIVKPYVIKKKAGRRIGIIGLLTDVRDVVDGDIAAQLKYLDPAEVTNRYAAYLKGPGKCDLVICLTHLGYEGEDYTDPELVADTRNVDVVVGGHSHTLLDSEKIFRNLDGKDVVVVTDWKWGLRVGRLDVNFQHK